MNDTTNPARRLRHGDRPTAPLRWNDRWTLLLTGPHHGLIGPLGSTWPDQSAEYERVDVCALPTGARVYPDRDPNKPAEEQGLFNKFIVMRTDGKDAPGEKHHGCAYFVLDLDHDRHAPAAMRSYASVCSETHPALAADLVAKFGKPRLDDIEQYRLQIAAIGTASFGYWKEGDSIHPDYDTVPLRDVARLYAKYDRLHKFREQVRVMVAMLKNREWAEDLAATGDAAELQSVITELVGAKQPIDQDAERAAVEEWANVNQTRGPSLDDVWCIYQHGKDAGRRAAVAAPDAVDADLSRQQTPVTGKMGEQALFEADCEARGKPLSRYSDGSYTAEPRARWEGWQARAALIQQAAPEAPIATPVGQVRDDIERVSVIWFGARPAHGTNLYAAPATHQATLAAPKSARDLYQEWIVGRVGYPVWDDLADSAQLIWYRQAEAAPASPPKPAAPEHVQLRQAADIVRTDLNAVAFPPPGVELTEEQHRHYAELAAFPPKLQRDALYQDYAVPTKADPT
jgi:hypothetical protein